MGLISLPLSNRVGVYQYWDSIWDNKFLYRRFFFYNIFINFFFSNIFNNLIFNIFLKNLKKKQYKKGIFISSYPFKNSICQNYLGKIWYYIFQNWVVLNLNIYTSGNYSITNIKKKNFSLNFFNAVSSLSYDKKIKKIKWDSVYKNLNYKYKL